jgi:acetyltransferase-like isoleucine patch superfamily enzyme
MTNMVLDRVKAVVGKLLDFYHRITLSGSEYARQKGVVVGKDCRITIRSFGTEPWLISIGDRVGIASGVVLLTHDGSTWLMNDEKGRRYLYRRIEIGDDVMIGSNSILMPGVKVGNNVVIAAGSVVTKSIPPGTVVAGNPAKRLTDFASYRTKILNECVSTLDVDMTLDHRRRTEALVDKKFKPYLE